MSYAMPDYLSSLPEPERQRYRDKLCVDGVAFDDPYAVNKACWTSDVKLLPPKSTAHVVVYLVFSPSQFTADTVAYKSLEAYDNFESVSALPAGSAVCGSAEMVKYFDSPINKVAVSVPLKIRGKKDPFLKLEGVKADDGTRSKVGGSCNGSANVTERFASAETVAGHPRSLREASALSILESRFPVSQVKTLTLDCSGAECVWFTCQIGPFASKNKVAKIELHMTLNVTRIMEQVCEFFRRKAKEDLERSKRKSLAASSVAHTPTTENPPSMPGDDPEVRTSLLAPEARE
ncbi:hypothetical protein HPB47_016632 [Ixodes persulcatus]|uniref:Uncharacterized protein n=1 Tax=Ixodes persulcatus TaxID=34615 RepID=A0AC60QRC6_IXOPE|nr:hypothetical protein HPB47_016632 [Ixodes persulcatus]